MLNIVVCGTPGTGKSSLIERLKPELAEFNFINLSKFALENDCTSGYDKSLDTHVIDEDKLITKLRPILEEKNLNIIESIHADLLPSESINWVYICRTDNTKLYDRLKARGYEENKISNNVEAEIFQVIYDETLENFDESILTELVSNEESDLERNTQTVVDKVKSLLATIRKS